MEDKTNIKIQQIHKQEEEQRAKNLATELGFPYINLQISPIDETGLLLATKEQAEKAKAAIIQKKQKHLFIACLDSRLSETQEFIKEFEKKQYKTSILIVSKSSLQRAWKRYENLNIKKTATTKETEINVEELKIIQEQISTIEDLKERLSKADINATDLLNIIIASALKLQASDVHLENEQEQSVRLRFRIDGMLQDICDILFSNYNLFLSRIKVLSGLKLNIHNVPQDGRFSFKSDNEEIENRVSIIPAEYGENIVIRILDPKAIGLELEELGIQEYDFELIRKELKKPNGMIITTGPTGSGKTTLLYAFLKKVNKPEIKVITLENPIEYHLEGIEQTQVNADKGYTFAAGLRSIVRQDPDMILVGEIRDEETAKTAINAALTGHLVFSTLHTNDAAGAIPRLVDMKVTTTLIPPALNLVIAQRLVRKVCSKCSIEIEPNKQDFKELDNLPKRAKKPEIGKIKQINEKGCEYCSFTGYKGRIGVFELFIINDSMEKTILKTPSIAEIRETAIKAGMITMKQDGLLKVIQKITTLEEVERVFGE
ncbi:MAG: GspE/PulE family protein [Patescibacteria group bacterium]